MPASGTRRSEEAKEDLTASTTTSASGKRRERLRLRLAALAKMRKMDLTAQEELQLDGDDSEFDVRSDLDDDEYAARA